MAIHPAPRPSASLRQASAGERIVHYIESEGADGTVTLTDSRKAWAAELGMTHEALYRALRRLQASGILGMVGNRMILSQRDNAARR
ncbi:MAG: winged helix-turn-helix domain-containing protein [Betaproteobacteria bacterium]|nr:winged helix-turn-helix domain-containing protein [Betaproteobacteria bacterium]